MVQAPGLHVDSFCPRGDGGTERTCHLARRRSGHLHRPSWVEADRHRGHLNQNWMMSRLSTEKFHHLPSVFLHYTYLEAHSFLSRNGFLAEIPSGRLLCICSWTRISLCHDVDCVDACSTYVDEEKIHRVCCCEAISPAPEQDQSGR